MKRLKQFLVGFIATLIILPLTFFALLWGWQTKTRCQTPLTLFVSSPLSQDPLPQGKSDFASLLRVVTENTTIPSWWKSQTRLQEYLGPVRHTAIQNQAVWLATLDTLERYVPESRQLFIYKYFTEDKAVARHIWDILVTQDGALWAMVDFDDIRLMRYNAQKDAFEVVRDQDNILLNWKADRKISFSGSSFQETTDGNLLMAFRNNLLLYAPRTNIARLLLPENFEFTVNSLAVSDNKVWFTVNETMDLWGLDIKTGVLKNYRHASEMVDDGGAIGEAKKDSHHSIAVDRLGRVWVGYFARLEPDQNGEYHWYSISYPPQFIIEDTMEEDVYFYDWATVYSVDVTSDDNIWFSSTAGLIKYDSKRDDWCLSAPGHIYSVAEDKDGYLWVSPYAPYNSIFKKYQELYKYSLTP